MLEQQDLCCLAGRDTYFYQKQTGRTAGKKRELPPGSHDPDSVCAPFWVCLFSVSTLVPVSSSIFVLWLSLVPSSISLILHHKFAPVVE